MRTSSRSSSIRRRDRPRASGSRHRAKLGDLKRAYIDAYLALHARARLGVDDDRRKGPAAQGRAPATTAESGDDRPDAQAATDGLPAPSGCAQELSSLLTEQELDAAAECPHCAFRPSVDPVQAAAGNVLSGLDGELDTLISTWTGILLNNLDDPTTRDQLELLGPDQRKRGAGVHRVRHASLTTRFVTSSTRSRRCCPACRRWSSPPRNSARRSSRAGRRPRLAN